MFPTGTEKNIIKVIAKLKRATTFQIQQEIGFSTSYIDYICKDLVRNDFLVFSNRQYSLSQGGIQVTSSQSDKRFRTDSDLIKDIVTQVTERLSSERGKDIDKESILKLATQMINKMAGDKKESFDRNNIKEIVSELASEVTKEVKKMVEGIQIATKERKEIGVSYSPIKIKTDFMLPIEDETSGLETNIHKVGAKLEKEKGDSLEKSIRLLKNLSKSKGGKYDND